jgi:RNA-splicing ligase RtcB
MKKMLFISLFTLLTGTMYAQEFDITRVKVKKDKKLEQLIFSISVKGMAGDSVPEPKGQLDGAPVLGYVFPTTLSPTAVGFDQTSGILALALTSHPDFDDTPLWDENQDAIYDNDGVIWHPHWVVLEENKSVPGGLAVKATTKASKLPPTNPGMPMYMDSPGYPVVTGGHVISCTVPLYRIQGKTDFKFDGVTALMYVNTSDPDKPMLGVHKVFSVASGDLSLPYHVK